MTELYKFLHLAGAIVWLGGMAFVLMSFRPVITANMQPPQRLPVLSSALARFFILVWVSIGFLLLTGFLMLMNVGMKAAPLGWHVMLGLGLLMCLIFGHLYFGPFRRLKSAVEQANWPEGGKQAAQIANLVKINFVLGWLAIAAVTFLR